MHLVCALLTVLALREGAKIAEEKVPTNNSFIRPSAEHVFRAKASCGSAAAGAAAADVAPAALEAALVASFAVALR